MLVKDLLNPNANNFPEIPVQHPTFDFEKSINYTNSVINQASDFMQRKNQAVFDTANNSKEQVEYLKEILNKYENITEQNKLQSAHLKELSDKYDSIIVQNERQSNENKNIKKWTVAGVIIMLLTLIAAIIIPIIINNIS